MADRIFHGIIPPLVTPFDSNDRLDEGALREVIRHVLHNGVHGVFVAGSTGEAYALEDEERVRTFEVAVDETAGKVPVLAGTSHITTRGAVRLTEAARRAGADAVSVVTPFFITPSEDELVDHYRAIAAAADPMAVLLYNNPDRTGVTIPLGAVRKLAELPNVRGIKDSSGDLTYGNEIIRAAPPAFSFFCGRDTLIFATLACGGRGAVPATGNVAPRLLVDLYEAFRRGDHEAARRAQQKVAPLRMAFGLGSFPVVLKEALNLIGIRVGTTRLPIKPLSPEKRDALRKVLADLGLLA